MHRRQSERLDHHIHRKVRPPLVAPPAHPYVPAGQRQSSRAHLGPRCASPTSSPLIPIAVWHITLGELPTDKGAVRSPRLPSPRSVDGSYRPLSSWSMARACGRAPTTAATTPARSTCRAAIATTPRPSPSRSPSWASRCASYDASSTPAPMLIASPQNTRTFKLQEGNCTIPALPR